jgi:glutamate racemase
LKYKSTSRSPIGVFDSGIGGLTVAKSIFKLLPNENIVYLGDSARLPYGTKSKETVILYSIECLKFLLKQRVKLIVIACNTSSAISVPFLSKVTTIPIISVIGPGASAATQITVNNKIGVIGTRATISSGAYQKEIKKLNKKAKVFSQNCSLFVQLAEDGWTDNKIAELTAKEYLADLQKSGIDTMIMGCTHYPILKDTIQKVVGKGIKLIDPGEETAAQVKRTLAKSEMLNSQKKEGYHKFYVTDFPVNFKDVSERFLGKKIKEVKKVKLT